MDPGADALTPSGGPPAGPSARPLLLLPLLLLPAVLLVAMGGPWSLSGDEALTARLAVSPWTTVVSSISADNHVPGYYGYLWLWVRALGDSPASLRASSLLVVAVMVAAAWRLLPRWTAVIVALSPFTAHLAVEVRMYGMLALWGLLLLAALRAWSTRPGLPRALLAGILVSAATWTHHFGWLGLPAALTVMAGRRAWRDMALVLLLPLLLYLPWAATALSQLGRFGGAALEGSSVYIPSPSLPARLLGVPFSLAGTLLRFSSGTSVFDFGLFSVRSLSAWLLPAAASALLLTISAAAGAFRRRGAALSMLAWVLLPLSLLRPSARHFALAFPAFALVASAGLAGPGRAASAARRLLPLLLLCLWVPLATRSTVPQRTTFHRDFREAAGRAAETAAEEDAPVVVDLDLYSTLALLYHLERLEASPAVAWHPHGELLGSDTVFYRRVPDATAYLTVDTDSMVEDWSSRYGRIVLLANDPTLARGPVTGEENPFIGMGSGVMSDMDLLEALEARAGVERVTLSGSEGPFSLLVVDFRR